MQKSIVVWIALSGFLASLAIVEARGGEPLSFEAWRIQQQREARDERITELRAMPLIKPVMVPIDASFAIGKYEVTFDEYDQFAAQNGRTHPDDKTFGRGRRPVINVTWDDAVAYAKWLSAKTGKHYRLPTEKEWDKACGMQTEYCGSNDIDAVAWNISNSWAATHPVGEKQPNQYGLYDMSGNVWEWTADCWKQDCSKRVGRGGDYFSGPVSIRSAHRGRRPSGTRSALTGFRLAQDL